MTNNPQRQQDEIAAALRASRELGPEYDEAVAASLVERVDDTIEERVKHHVARQMGANEARRGLPANNVRMVLSLVCLGISIPTTAIAARGTSSRRCAAASRTRWSTGSPAPRAARGITYCTYCDRGICSWRHAYTRTRTAKRTFGMAVPRATPISPSGRTSTMLRPRFNRPAMRNAMVGKPGLSNPIRMGCATPLTGRKIRYEATSTWSTSPAGPSKEGSIHQAMKRGPKSRKKRHAMSVSESAILDHLRKISVSCARSPSVFSFVAIGETTAAMATMNSIK